MQSQSLESAVNQLPSQAAQAQQPAQAQPEQKQELDQKVEQPKQAEAVKQAEPVKQVEQPKQAEQAKQIEQSDRKMPVESKGFGHYAKATTAAITGFLGNVGISTAITTALVVFGMYVLTKLNIGLILGLLSILAVGFAFKYISNISLGRGFNPLNHGYLS